MSEIHHTFQQIYSIDQSDSSSLVSSIPRSLSSYSNWRINYKPISKKSESKGVWAGYQTQDEFMSIHLR